MDHLLWEQEAAGSIAVALPGYNLLDTIIMMIKHAGGAHIRMDSRDAGV